MQWLWILKLFQSKIGKILFKFIKNKELRKFFKKGLFNKGLFDKSFNKDLFEKIFEKGLFEKGQLSGKKVRRITKRPKRDIEQI